MNKSVVFVSTITMLGLVFGAVLPMPVRAATTPSLGVAATFGILASTYTNTVSGTTITGDLGYVTGPATAPTVSGSTYINNGSYSSAGSAQGSALASLASESCTFTFPPGAVDLSTETTHGTAGTYTPGVYCGDAAMDVGGPLNLSGSGTYIFRSVGALTSTAGATVTLSGASACDVFWTPAAATTLAANTTFAGTVISDAGITIGANTTWSGRALAFGGTVSTDTDTIAVPTCTTSSSSTSAEELTGTINVVKLVVNDNGGDGVVADFPLFVNATPVVSGATNTFTANSTRYAVTESNTAGYTQSFSGDCDEDGVMYLHEAEHLFCIITNNDIGAAIVVPPVPPIIDLVKVPSPLGLPGGAGSVTSTFTVRNIGTVPMTNVTLVDDTCTPAVLISGDANTNATLEVSETWIYECTDTVTETHTNTAVVTGWANGLSATDIASATVVVGVPLEPPLIHVTKVPSPLTLLAGGGAVTYTERISNPGTVALENVALTDDKCGPVAYVSGDSNDDNLLDVSETWTYTCTATLTATTTNTASAVGEANGYTVRDVAIATVVVAGAVPELPATGFAPGHQREALIAFVAAGVLAAFAVFAIRKYHI